MRRAGLAAVGVCMLFAACGGTSDESSDASDTVVTSEVADTVAATAVVAPATVADSTTTTSTATTSTTAATTLAPTTTLSPEQAAIAAAEAAVVKAFDARTAALADPTNPDARRVLGDAWSGYSLPAILDQVDEFASGGMVLRISTDPVSFVRVVGESAVVEPGRIDVAFCRLDSNVIVLDERVAGVEAIIDDSTTTRIWHGAVVLEDGRWRLDGAEIQAEAEGEVGCEELQ
ncbi:MAG: hypothetical protein QNM02_21675 [Acidimicrobiia bacterium]|nr:hypothetical protein [Acidimicrobiia bacterium]